MRALTLFPLILLAACGGTATPPAVIQTPPEAPIEEITVPETIEQPAPPPPDPLRLSGLNPKEVQAIVGEPTLVRRDGSVQAMLFENGDCVFEVIFYEPSENDHFIAKEINARSRRGTEVDHTACLIKVLPNGNWIDQQ